jgi:hypothetical protein
MRMALFTALADLDAVLFPNLVHVIHIKSRIAIGLDGQTSSIRRAVVVKRKAKKEVLELF